LPLQRKYTTKEQRLKENILVESIRTVQNISPLADNINEGEVHVTKKLRCSFPGKICATVADLNMQDYRKDLTEAKILDIV
jgi:hypothetical protein